MALTPDTYACGEVPTVEADAGSAVTAGKTWALPTGALVTNTSGAARTVTFKRIASDGTTVRWQTTVTLPTTAEPWPVALAAPLLASEKLRWVASGASVYADVPVVKN